VLIRELRFHKLVQYAQVVLSALVRKMRHLPLYITKHNPIALTMLMYLKAVEAEASEKQIARIVLIIVATITNNCLLGHTKKVGYANDIS
jgi:hypothetical protein